MTDTPKSLQEALDNAAIALLTNLGEDATLDDRIKVFVTVAKYAEAQTIAAPVEKPRSKFDELHGKFVNGAASSGRGRSQKNGRAPNPAPAPVETADLDS